MTINNTTVANSLYGRSVSGTSTVPFIDVFMPRDPTPQDTQYVVQQKWLNTLEGHFWELQNFTSLTGFVQANWVKIASSQHVETLTGNVGGPVAPIGNNINVVGDTTTINVVGNPGTATLLIETGDLVPTVFVEDVGAAAPLVSTINVLGGLGIATSGSGNTITISTTGAVAESFTTNAGVAIPALGNLNILGAGTVTTSGAGSTVTITGTSPPSGFTSINNQIFTTSGTYTPTAGMLYCSIQCLAGGGAGGGIPASGGGDYGCGTGGGAGEYAQGIFSAASIGVSQTVTIGAGGLGVSGGTGGTGGNTSVGALISCIGGNGGTGGTNPLILSLFGPAGGTGGTGGNVRSPGAPGGAAYSNVGSQAVGGLGGNTQYGVSGVLSINTDGNPGLGYGSGGAGTASGGTGAAYTGGDGADGIVIITEYIG